MLDTNTSASSWDFGDTTEELIHRIHPYPARFPAFITTKALQHADDQGVRVRNVADVFCGCGTTAVEAKRNGKDFWGCDINPLATLIAQVKTHCYRDSDLERTLAAIRHEAGNADSEAGGSSAGRALGSSIGSTTATSMI